MKMRRKSVFSEFCRCTAPVDPLEKERKVAQELRSQSDGCQTTLFSETEGLTALFETMASGRVPNFLEMIAALNDISAHNADDADFWDGVFCSKCS